MKKNKKKEWKVSVSKNNNIPQLIRAEQKIQKRIYELIKKKEDEIHEKKRKLKTYGTRITRERENKSTQLLQRCQSNITLKEKP